MEFYCYEHRSFSKILFLLKSVVLSVVKASEDDLHKDVNSVQIEDDDVRVKTVYKPLNIVHKRLLWLGKYVVVKPMHVSMCFKAIA